MSQRRRYVPPVAWLAAAALAQKLFTQQRVCLGRRILGGGVTAAAGALGVWAVKGFAQRHASFDPFDVDSAGPLVMEGAHSVSRHPMYGAMLLGLIGRSIATGRVKSLLPVAALWVALETQARDEENALTEKFGRSYLKYQDRVPKWI